MAAASESDIRAKIAVPEIARQIVRLFHLVAFPEDAA